MVNLDFDIFRIVSPPKFHFNSKITTIYRCLAFFFANPGILTSHYLSNFWEILIKSVCIILPTLTFPHHKINIVICKHFSNLYSVFSDSWWWADNPKYIEIETHHSFILFLCETYLKILPKKFFINLKNVSPWTNTSYLLKSYWKPLITLTILCQWRAIFSGTYLLHVCRLIYLII